MKIHCYTSVAINVAKVCSVLIGWENLKQMGFWKTVLAVFVGVLLYEVADNIVVAVSAYLTAG